MKTTTVYWACLEKEWMRAPEPTPVLSKFLTNTEDSPTKTCPAIKKSLNNIFELKSIYDYSFTITEDSIVSRDFDQAFYERFIKVRSFEERLFSFVYRIIFFTEEDSLQITGNLMPYMENNHITERCILVPGEYDIGKWFRPVEFAFFLKPQFDTFTINSGEVYQYVQFHTENKINLKQFKLSPELAKYLTDVDASRDYRRATSNLKYFYDTFKLKKQIVKEIKENLI
jgi:hypothetical protein